MADDFYQRDIRAAIKGMAHLTPEERGCYNTIIDHQYLMGGPLPDNDKHLCGLMNCDIRVWKRIKQQLISKGRIEIVQASYGLAIADVRASCEIAKRELARSQKVAAGQLGGISSGQSRKIKHLGEAEPKSASTKTNHIREENIRGEDSNAAPTGAPAGEDPASMPEKELFERGKAVLGSTAGGLVAKLLKAKSGSVALARAALEQASTKQDPREYIGAIIRGSSGKSREDQLQDEQWDRLIRLSV